MTGQRVLITRDRYRPTAHVKMGGSMKRCDSIKHPFDNTTGNLGANKPIGIISSSVIPYSNVLRKPTTMTTLGGSLLGSISFKNPVSKASQEKNIKFIF
jgi:hypothetical protein